MKEFRLKKETSKVISENDKMFTMHSGNSLEFYFYVSESAIACIFYALNMAGKTDVKSILDFPCGHGRVLRSLVSYFPDAEITACDLEKDGVDFCVKTFSVNGVYSNEDISKINLGRKYDLIWVGSLLTHFPEKTSRKFIDFLFDHLEEDGLLVISLHGRYAVIETDKQAYYRELVENYKKNEYVFIPPSYYSYYIDGDNSIPDYGDAFTKVSWISSLIQDNENMHLVYYSEKRFANHHDVFAIQKRNIRKRETIEHLVFFRKMEVLESEIISMRNELNGVYNSKSWKITKPLRKLMGILRYMSN